METTKKNKKKFEQPRAQWHLGQPGQSRQSGQLVQSVQSGHSRQSRDSRQLGKQDNQENWGNQANLDRTIRTGQSGQENLLIIIDCGGHIGKIDFFRFSKKNYYPHRSRDALSPVCGIFLALFKIIVPFSDFRIFANLSFGLFGIFTDHTFGILV